MQYRMHNAITNRFHVILPVMCSALSENAGKFDYHSQKLVACSLVQYSDCCPMGKTAVLQIGQLSEDAQ